MVRATWRVPQDPLPDLVALAHEIGHLVMHDGTGSEDMEQEATPSPRRC